MSIYEKCDRSITEMANEILCKYATHKPVLDARVKIDFVYAYAKTDDKGQPVGDALRCHGVKALGICRKLKLKDRVMGRGDVEISLDGDWWRDASDEERRALLDHELHHIVPEMNQQNQPVTDDFGRPKIHMRKHDFEFGWFMDIAKRHGMASGECRQAKAMREEAGQYFWPSLVG